MKLRALLLALMAYPVLVLGQGAYRFDKNVTSPTGQAIPQASIAVCTEPANTSTTPCSTLARLYPDSGGTNYTISAIACLNDVVTVSTSVSNTAPVNQWVVTSAVPSSAFNGVPFQVTSSTLTRIFTYAAACTNASSSGRTASVANPAFSDGFGNYFWYAPAGAYRVPVDGESINTLVFADQFAEPSGLFKNTNTWTGSNIWNQLGTFNAGLTSAEPNILNGWKTISNITVIGNVAHQPVTSDAIQYVSAGGNDSNDGFSPGSAKATIGGARSALPTIGSAITGTIRIAAGTYTLSSTLAFAAKDNICLIGNPGTTIVCAATSGDCIDYGQNVRFVADGPGAQVMNGPIIKTNSSANVQNIIGPAAGLTTESSGFSMTGWDVSHQAGTVSRALVDECCSDNASSISFGSINAQSGAGGTFTLLLVDGVNVNDSSTAIANINGKVDSIELNCNQVSGCTPLQLSSSSASGPIQQWQFENIAPEFPGRGLHNISINATALSLGNISFKNIHMESGTVGGDFVLINGGVYSVDFNNVGCYNQSTNHLNCFKITDTVAKHPTSITLENVSTVPSSSGLTNYVNNAVNGLTLGVASLNSGFLPGYVFNNTFWGATAAPGYYFDGSAVPKITGTGACATTSTQKGGLSGQITCTGTGGASTLVITPGLTSANGWSCSASDVTHTLAGSQSAVSTTACTITFSTVTANDVLTFTAVAY